MNAPHAIVYAIGLCVAGAAVAWLFSGNKKLAGWVTFLITAASAWLAFTAGWEVLLRGPAAWEVWNVPALNSSLKIYVDGLAVLFLGLIALIASLASLYSITYMEHYKEYGVARFYPWFLLFVGGMYGIVTTTDLMFFFCFFWQLMTLPSYVLIRYESRKPENVRAANKYLLMMEIACALVMVGGNMLGAALPAGTVHRFDFDVISANLPDVIASQPGVLTGALFLFLLGFGIKAGMWPFGQMWLPDAHPAAPSPVSALLSGVMIKTGIYGLMRSFLWLVPAQSLADYPAHGWGFLIAVLGTITLFVGTAQALKQEQSKRLLAFHSIGQIGYILLGLGASLALMEGQPGPMGGLAAAALLGAIFHMLNHGVFKSLLFMNAGAMLYATDTQDLNRMGGLMKYMPVTALATLVASFSIAGVPLFNGFASKWSIYVATIVGSQWAPWLAVCAVVAILTSVLTLASFMKFFGVSFLSRTSNTVAARARGEGSLEVNFLMQLPQAVLAALCLVMGMVPLGMTQVFIVAIEKSYAPGAPLTTAALFDVIRSPTAQAMLPQSAAGTPAAFVAMVLVVVMVGAFVVAHCISRLGNARRRSADIWLCGYAKEADIHRYNAHNLYGEVKRYFRWVGGHGSAGHAKPTERAR